MVYADYEFYTTQYKGNSIPEFDFGRLILRSSYHLNRITGDRVKQTPDSESVKMAACAVAEAIQINEQGDVTSQSVGSWSKTVQKAEKSDSQRITEAAQLYLGNLVQTVRWC